MRNAEVIVVGLGAMGSAACFQLATRGVSVIGIDQYAPPHPWGSTHGDTRVTREAIGEGREYVPLVRRSHQLWREIERESGARLLTQCGIVVLAYPSSEFLEETRASARAYEIEHEDLANAEARARFPMFALDDEIVAYHEPGAGYVRPEAAVAAQLGLARAGGAQLSLGERVQTWSASLTASPSPPTRTRIGPISCSCAPARGSAICSPRVVTFRRLPPAPVLVPDPRGVRPTARHAGLHLGSRRRATTTSFTSTASTGSPQSTVPTAA